jgi:hypothetical protein
MGDVALSWSLFGVLTAGCAGLLSALYALVGRMDTLGTELRGEMRALRTELRGEMQELRADLRSHRSLDH